MPKAEYDKQGKYFWHLVKLAGWNEERVNKLLLKKYSATHWNALSQFEKRSAINTMKYYAEKEREAHNKRMRSMIMAKIIKNGLSKEWLYDTLNIKPERTLSKMDYPELIEVYKQVKLMFPDNEHKINKTSQKEKKNG
ncbi:MAG TPA: hypothetical protein PKH17_03775 [Candidatus Syntrophosphaera sp.]|nr:hypothetical protein [Candidatus Syntrophosphaera sp.]